MVRKDYETGLGLPLNEVQVRGGRAVLHESVTHSFMISQNQLRGTDPGSCGRRVLRSVGKVVTQG